MDYCRGESLLEDNRRSEGEALRKSGNILQSDWNLRKTEETDRFVYSKKKFKFKDFFHSVARLDEVV